MSTCGYNNSLSPHFAATIHTRMAVLCKKNILCINNIGKFWIDQGVDNQNLFLGAFENRCQDICTSYTAMSK